MNPLPEPAWTELEDQREKRRLPPLRWFAQSAAAFAAVAFVGGLMIAPGGLVERIGGMTPATTLSLPRADMEGGQYYDQQWINPATGRPYADQVDAQSTDYASVEPALYYNDGTEEPLEGARVSTVSNRNIEQAVLADEHYAADPAYETTYETPDDTAAYDDGAAYDPSSDEAYDPMYDQSYDGLYSGA